MVLLFHKPVNCSELLAFAREADRVGCLVSPPSWSYEGKNDDWCAEHTPDDVTLRTVELINSMPQVKCIINGHMHENFVCRNDLGVPVILTAHDTVRVIEFT